MAKRTTLSPIWKPFWKTCGDDVFARALVFNMHHGVVQIGIEGVARFAEGGDAQGVCMTSRRPLMVISTPFL